MVDDHGAGVELVHGAVSTEQHLAYGGSVADAHRDDRGTLDCGRRGRSRGARGVTGQPFVGARSAAVPRGDGVPGGDEVPGHREAHHSEAQECDASTVSHEVSTSGTGLAAEPSVTTSRTVLSGPRPR